MSLLVQCDTAENKLILIILKQNHNSWKMVFMSMLSLNSPIKLNLYSHYLVSNPWCHPSVSFTLDPTACHQILTLMPQFWVHLAIPTSSFYFGSHLHWLCPKSFQVSLTLQPILHTAAIGIVWPGCKNNGYVTFLSNIYWVTTTYRK